MTSTRIMLVKRSLAAKIRHTPSRRGNDATPMVEKLRHACLAISTPSPPPPI